jgi:hypothetical protein
MNWDGKTQAGIDIADLYDHEVATVDRIGKEIAHKFSHRTATFENLEELVKFAHGRFLEEGFIVEVDTAKCLVLGEAPEIMIIGKVPGHDDHKHGFDHERKRHEVLKSKDTGEKYLGQRKAMGG